MIGYFDISYSIIELLKSKFKDINVPPGEEKSGFKLPAFFVEILALKDSNYFDYEEKKFTVIISYHSALKTQLDNIAMQDKLNKAFKNKLLVKGRSLTIDDKRFEISGNLLFFKFDIQFIQSTEVIEKIDDEGRIVQVNSDSLDEAIGYDENNIEFAREIEI